MCCQILTTLFSRSPLVIAPLTKEFSIFAIFFSASAIAGFLLFGSINPSIGNEIPPSVAYLKPSSLIFSKNCTVRSAPDLK